MSQRKVSFAPGEYYHIYNRGNSKQTIFQDEEDRVRFLQLLFLSNTSKPFNLSDIRKCKDIFEYERIGSLVSIGLYTLMPNHFHILVRDIKEGGDISKFMQKLSTGYSMYYNQKYERTGSLFEGKFKASHVATDRYLKYLFSYIHLNCIKLIEPSWKEKGIKDKHKALKYLNGYPWSSYIDYVKTKSRPFSLILDKKSFPSYFSSPKALHKELFSWLTYHS